MVEGRWIPFALGVAVASAFLGIEPTVGAAVVRPFDFGVVGVAALFVVRIVRHARVPRVRPGPALAFMAAFLGWKSLNAMVQSTSATAVVETLQAVELVAVFWMITVATRTRRGLHRFMAGMIWMTAGIVVWATGYHVSNGDYFRFKDLGEPKHTFGILFALLVIARLERVRRPRWGPHALTIGSVVVLTVLAGERKMWVAALVVVIGVVFGKRHRAGRSLGAAVVLIVLAAVLAVGPLTLEVLPENNYTARQLRSISEVPRSIAGDGDDDSLTISNRSRGELTRLAVEQFRAHPAVGMGPDRFAPFVRSLGDEGPEAGKTPHNEYLLVAVETGLVGLILFGAFVGTIAAGAARARRRLDDGEAGIWFIFVFSLFAITVNFFLAGGVLNILLLIIPAAVASSHGDRRVLGAAGSPP